MIPLILPEWQAPTNVKALATTRAGGVSPPPYESLNLGDHVGDSSRNVDENRRRLSAQLGPRLEIGWLSQVHGTDVLPMESYRAVDNCADASYSRSPGKACAVMTADCLPVLFCSAYGNEVAAAHAGWRGLQSGVLERTLEHFDALPADVMVWLGPAIGPERFEVGAEVREAFMRVDPQASLAFQPSGDKYLADIYLLARQRLIAAGVQKIYGGNYCTVGQPELFFSYRREKTTGRMVSLIWFE
ncbi:peptidoglycan editing factor PgeF [Leminorella grimontii]|uniref:peptidoglycan editing factor PgeF n=1 Tax=Leminorella grimontii TaxID=82981 RepID=UPI0032205F0F